MWGNKHLLASVVRPLPAPNSTSLDISAPVAVVVLRAPLSQTNLPTCL